MQQTQKANALISFFFHVPIKAALLGDKGQLFFKPAPPAFSGMRIDAKLLLFDKIN